MSGDYEQCALPTVRRARRIGESVGWHMYREDKENGRPVVVLV